MKIEGVKRLAENAIVFAERIDFPTMLGSPEHSDSIQSLAYAISGLAGIVKEQQLIIDSLTNTTNKDKDND